MNRSPSPLRSSAARGAGLCSLVLAALLTTGAAGGCADAAKSGPAHPEPGPLPVPSLARAWATELDTAAKGKSPINRLYDRGDYVFAYTDAGLVYVLRRETGLLVRTDDVAGGSYRLRAPIVLKEVVAYPTTTDVQIFQHNGIKVRTIEMGAAIRNDAVGEGNSIFVAIDALNGAGQVKRLDLNQPTNLPIWALQVNRGGIPGSPAVHNGILYCAQEDGRVYAVATETREPIWSMEGLTFDARNAVVADLKADDAGVYVATFEGKLYCLNRINGMVKWQYFGSGPLENSPVVTADSVYQIDPNRGWVAIDKNENPDVKTPQYNRAHRWASKDIRQILAQDDKNVFVLTRENAIVALDKKTGEERFRGQRKDLVTFATNTRDGTIFGADKSGRVMAIKAIYLPGMIGEIVLADAPLPAVALAR